MNVALPAMGRQTAPAAFNSALRSPVLVYHADNDVHALAALVGMVALNQLSKAFLSHRLGIL
jgi:hypothetical protein